MIGVASTWSEVTPCNIHLHGLAEKAKSGVEAAGGFPMIFKTITVADGILMGTEGFATHYQAEKLLLIQLRLLELQRI